MNKKIVAIFFAVLAAVLYAINIPLSKLLLQHIGPTMLASYLYLGAGIGIGAVFLMTKKRASHTGERITKKDLPFVLGMIVLDTIAPILLMFGLLDSASANASLLNDFEIVCTSMISLLIFKEAVSGKMWLAIMIAGTVIVVLDTLARKHSHLHKHTVTHTHDGSTHTHTVEHEHEHEHCLSAKRYHHRHRSDEIGGHA